jgi:hypothetical protein
MELEYHQVLMCYKVKQLKKNVGLLHVFAQKNLGNIFWRNFFK